MKITFLTLKKRFKNHKIQINELTVFDVLQIFENLEDFITGDSKTIEQDFNKQKDLIINIVKNFIICPATLSLEKLNKKEIEQLTKTFISLNDRFYESTQSNSKKQKKRPKGRLAYNLFASIVVLTERGHSNILTFSWSQYLDAIDIINEQSEKQK